MDEKTMPQEEIQEVALEIARQLDEENEAPLNQIKLLVEHCGKEFVEAILEETNKIEEKGGILTDDKKRRRTKGGVFFYLIKGKIEADVRQIVFPNFGQQTKGTVIEWEERLEHVQSLLEEGTHGTMRYVSITLNGRPGQVYVKDNSVILTITHLHNQTPLPKGVPHPPEAKTLYIVYMSIRHWEAVEETINTYKHDRLIIEGTCFMDPETDSIAVFATRVTTRRLEKMERRAQQQAEDASETTETGQSVTLLPVSSVQVPEGTPPDAAEKLKQLYSAAETLRARIDTMEKKNQPGVAMTKKLLRTTEKQIEAIERQYS